MREKKSVLLISEDSSLRYNDSFPDRETTLLFDCLVSFADQISLSYRRLKISLHEKTLNTNNEDILVLRNVAEFSDAWTIIHTTYRLKGILLELNKMYENIEPNQETNDVFSEAHQLRNVADHLNSRGSISRLAKNGYPINGILYWRALDSHDMYVNGSTQGSYYGHEIKSESAKKNAIPKFTDTPVTEIELLMGRHNFHITDGVFILKSYLDSLSDAIEKHHPKNNGPKIVGVTLGGSLSIGR